MTFDQGRGKKLLSRSYFFQSGSWKGDLNVFTASNSFYEPRKTITWETKEIKQSSFLSAIFSGANSRFSTSNKKRKKKKQEVFLARPHKAPQKLDYSRISLVMASDRGTKFWKAQTKIQEEKGENGGVTVRDLGWMVIFYHRYAWTEKKSTIAVAFDRTFPNATVHWTFASLFACIYLETLIS